MHTGALPHDELRRQRDDLLAENIALKQAWVYQTMLAEEARNVGMAEGDAADALIAALSTENDALRARVAELERLIVAAYTEGFYRGAVRAQNLGVDWDNRPGEWHCSKARAALMGRKS